MAVLISVPAESLSPMGEHTLYQIRKRFVQAGSRYDLIVNGDLNLNKDNGANFYINEGQKYLDLHARHTKSLERLYGVLAAGEFMLTFDNVISVEEVTVVDESEDTIINFTTEDFYAPSAFRRKYPQLIENWTTGTPVALSLGICGVSGAIDLDAATLDALGVVDYDEAVFGNSYGKTALLWYPKADVDYTVKLLARTYARTLVLDTDYSVWSVQYPSLLVMAACRMAEQFMNNTTGVRDWDNALAPWLNQLDNTLVEQEMFGKSDMEY